MRVHGLVGRVVRARGAARPQPPLAAVPDPLVALMLERFVLGLRPAGATDPPTDAELARAAQLARAWQEQGAFDVDEVRDWLELCPHVTPDVAVQLTLEGVTPQDAAEQLWLGRRERHRAPLWSRVQFREITPREAAEEVRRAHGS
jgi:hypothetical protein